MKVTGGSIQTPLNQPTNMFDVHVRVLTVAIYGISSFRPLRYVEGKGVDRVDREHDLEIREIPVARRILRWQPN